MTGNLLHLFVVVDPVQSFDVLVELYLNLSASPIVVNLREEIRAFFGSQAVQPFPPSLRSETERGLMRLKQLRQITHASAPLSSCSRFDSSTCFEQACRSLALCDRRRLFP